MTKDIQKNILFTIAYYDVMDYPLTTFEMWRHLLDSKNSRKQVSFLDVANALESENLKKIISQTDGFWHFRSRRSDLARDRRAKQKISAGKFKMIKKWLKFLDATPYVRAVFATGTLAMKRSKIGSDWDVMIVLAKDRIWIGRLFSTLVLHLLGKRRYGKRIKNRFCLNHFLAEGGLILEEQSFFSANEVSFSVPLLGGSQYKKFQQLNRTWVNSFQPNFSGDLAMGNVFLSPQLNRIVVKKFFELVFEKFLVGKFLNLTAKKFMIRKIQRNEKTHLEGADVRYSDQAMVFLPRPQRDKIMQKAISKLTISSR